MGYNYRAFGLEGLANLSMRSGIGTGYDNYLYTLALQAATSVLKHTLWFTSINLHTNCDQN